MAGERKRSGGEQRHCETGKEYVIDGILDVSVHARRRRAEDHPGSVHPSWVFRRGGEQIVQGCETIQLPGMCQSANTTDVDRKRDDTHFSNWTDVNIYQDLYHLYFYNHSFTIVYYTDSILDLIPSFLISSLYIGNLFTYTLRYWVSFLRKSQRRSCIESADRKFN